MEDNEFWWKCGGCGKMTTQTHYFPDENGVMQHMSKTFLKNLAERLAK